MKNISNFATWPGDFFYNNENYLSARVMCHNSCIFSPIMSKTVKESLHPDLDSRYYRILYSDSCLLPYNHKDFLLQQVSIK